MLAHSIVSYIQTFYYSIQASKLAIMHHESEWPRKYLTIFILTLGYDNVITAFI